MAYWWVSQNQTFRQERAGGYLWAPKRNVAGQSVFHWTTMTEVRPGDVIFSYVQQSIAAVSVATGKAYDRDRPYEFRAEETWMSDGWCVDVVYEDIASPISIAQVAPAIQPYLPDLYSPLTVDGRGSQGYLFSLPPRAGRIILELVGGSQSEAASRDNDDAVLHSLERATPSKTERVALVQSRIGQGRFRDEVLALWRGRCCVTGLDVSSLLRASHIKPWRDANNAERLDQFNGLLLALAYDAAFDAGFITFRDDGSVDVSQDLSPQQLICLGIDPSRRIEALAIGHRKYLAHHRSDVFRVPPTA